MTLDFNLQKNSSLKTEEEKDNEVIDVKNAALFLKISVRTLYRLLASDCQLPCTRVGRQYRFVRSELLRWLKGECE